MADKLKLLQIGAWRVSFACDRRDGASGIFLKTTYIIWKKNAHI